MNTTDLSITDHSFDNLSVGNYIVRVKTACGFTQQTLSLVQGTTAIPDPVATSNTICLGENTTLSIGLSTTIFSLQWYDEANNPLGTAASQVVSPAVTTTYKLSYEVGTLSGCSTSETGDLFITITVSPEITQGTVTTACSADGSATYTVQAEILAGTAPYTVSGTGAPGTWSANIWTSDPIASGVDYNLVIEDTNACNELIITGTDPSGACDFDGDGVPYATDVCNGFDDALDNDADGVPDGCDQDDDNDGILDTNECYTVESARINITTRIPDPNNTGNGEVDFGLVAAGDIYLYPTVVNANGIGYDLKAEIIEISMANPDGQAYFKDNGFNLFNANALQDDYVIIEYSFVESGTGNLSLISDIEYIYKDVDGKVTLREIVGVETSDIVSATHPGTGTDPLQELGFENGRLQPAYTMFRQANGSNLSTNLDTNDITIKYNSNIFRVLLGATGTNTSSNVAFRPQLNVIIPCDTDNDGVFNHVDTDSDGDGCSDANEAYGNNTVDGGDGGAYGTGAIPAINADGTVVAASYASPVDNNTNGTKDFQEAGAAPVISMEPTNQKAFSGSNGLFELTASNADQYQWQVSTDGGINFNNIIDGTEYTGVLTSTLTIISADISKNGFMYRSIIINDAYSCAETISNQVILTVGPRSVITNKRITTRVKKN